MSEQLSRFLLTASACSLIADAAQACPVCILADPKTAGTYLGMTLLMSALPLALLGGLIYWLKRRYSARTSAFPTNLRVPTGLERSARDRILTLRA